MFLIMWLSSIDYRGELFHCLDFALDKMSMFSLVGNFDTSISFIVGFVRFMGNI